MSVQTDMRLVTVADLEEAADRGHTVHAADGPLGTAHTVYYDRLDGRPRWLAVRERDGSLLLLPAAVLQNDGSGLTAPFSRRHVLDAPPAAGSDIDPATERRLAEHYRLGHDDRGVADQPLHREGWGHTPRPAAYRPAEPRRRAERRPFWLTSEFVLLVLGVFAMFVASATDPDELPHQRAWIVASIMGAAYILSRGIAKAGRRARVHDPRDDDGYRGAETTPFWETSELLVLIVAIVGIFITTIADPVSLTHERAWMCFTIVGGSYILSRGLAKSAGDRAERG